MNRAGPRQIREMLQERLPDLLARLLPGARVTYPVMTPLNPARDDRRPGSFVIWTRGAARGGWREYSPKGGEAAGDVIDLIAYCLGRGRDRAFALRWAEDFLGIRAMPADELLRAKRTARKVAEQEARSASDRDAQKRRRAFALWRKAKAEIAGTVAEDYLASRGIPWRALQNPETDLRFHAGLEHWRSAQWKGKRKIEPGPKCPAIVAAMRNASGDVTAVHCTFLRADGTGKADVEKPKLMYGQVRAALIRLSLGPAGLSFEEAAANGVVEPLIVTEGLETGLSVALAVPEARVAAAGSLDNIANAYVGHPCVDRWYAAFDADPGAAAAEARARVMAALEASGVPGADMTPADAGADFNDLLREA